jgi:predicted PurR-regulated permease PerM
MLPPNAQTPLWLREHGSRVMTAGTILALLYAGRNVLIPLALAIMLSLLVTPLVRALRQIGIGRTASVFVAILALTVFCMAAAVALGTQILRIADSLPQYEATVQRKLRTLDEVTVGRLRLLTRETSRLIEIHDPAQTMIRPSNRVEQSMPSRSVNVVMPEPSTPATQPLQLIGQLLTSIWGPLQATGIVLLVLVFVLLEHESLRDRFIRLAGTTDIRSTTLALNDAAERLSRFFVSQFLVNLCFGVAVGVSLRALHVPESMLCGALAGAMRFVPYVGVGIAAIFATSLAFAVDPGWTLTVATLAVFILLDLVAAQLLEPHLYGHATGLSPLSVVVAAIFWSSLWGPVGLILSTPLTLCLVVAGRHIKTLGPLEMLLSDAQALTWPQRFYQRALCGDADEIIADARAFLKRNSLAAYFDRVLMPALHLAHLDADAHATSEDQRLNIRRVTVSVVAALCNSGSKLSRRRSRGSVLEDLSAGRLLRQQREQVSGRWQGPLGVPSGSVVICLGLSSSADDLAAELLARLMLAQKVDARHFSPGDLAGAKLPPGADPDGVSIIYLVSAFPTPERDRADSITKQATTLFPYAHVVRVFCPGMTTSPAREDGASDTEQIASSLVEAIDICMSWQEARGKRSVQPQSPNTTHEAIRT